MTDFKGILIIILTYASLSNGEIRCGNCLCFKSIKKMKCENTTATLPYLFIPKILILTNAMVPNKEYFDYFNKTDLIDITYSTNIPCN